MISYGTIWCSISNAACKERTGKDLFRIPLLAEIPYAPTLSQSLGKGWVPALWDYASSLASFVWYSFLLTYR